MMSRVSKMHMGHYNDDVGNFITSQLPLGYLQTIVSKSMCDLCG